METATYRKQHAELDRMASALAGSSVPAGIARRDLARFSTALRSHLRLEARALYPALLHDDDPAIRDLAAEFHLGLSRLLGLFNPYCAQWSAPGAIEADRARFARETRSMAATVRRRIALENDELFAAIDHGPAISA